MRRKRSAQQRERAHHEPWQCARRPACPKAFNVVIEISMGADPIKYEVDKETGAIFVDRFMATAVHYPTNYGYVPRTLSGDGDPVDVLVITPFPLLPGVVVTCRPDRNFEDARRGR